MKKIKDVNFISMASIIGLVIVFVFSLFKGNSIMDSMGISGFIGMFVQMILTIIQNIFEYRPESVMFIAKNSSFSLKIMQGVILKSSTLNGVKLSTELIENGEISVSSQINEKIMKNIKKYDSFLIRIDDDNMEFHNVLDNLYKLDKKFLLLDKEISDSNKEITGTSPACVMSDFQMGGKLLGSKISGIYSPGMNIVVSEVVNKHESGIRISSLTSELLKNNIEYEKVELYSYDKNEFLQKILKKGIIEKCDILICPNDDIAYDLMRKLRIENEHYKNFKDIIFVGYDGLRDGKNYKIDSYGFKYITIDTCPEIQGEEAMDLIIKSESKDLIGKKLKIMPRLIHNLDN